MMPDLHASPPRLVLASASPRRRELLAALGLVFDVIATGVEESGEFAQLAPPAELANLPAAVPADDHPTLLGWRKAFAAAAQLPGCVVLGADTVVVLDGAVLNKPRDPAHARAMLRQLAGRTHTVYTGLCLITADGVPLLDLARAEVAFHPLAEATISAYVATGEPMDKAGAYGLQGQGGDLVREVIGSYTAVVGLPVAHVSQLLRRAGIAPAVEAEQAYQRWLARQGKEVPPCPPTTA